MYFLGYHGNWSIDELVDLGLAELEQMLGRRPGRSCVRILCGVQGLGFRV